MSKNVLKKIAIVAAIVILFALFKIFNLGDYFTLSYIKESQERFATLYTEHQFAVIAVYMGIYVMVTSLSLPGAAVMTLAGRALFGLWVGTLVVSFASSIGATLACFIARFVFRDWIQGKFGEKLATVNKGFEEEGAFYLFTMRLIPVIPFWLINLVMGLTKMRLMTFYWVSQVGMLLGTMVYVNAGKEMAKIETLKGILSPSLILSFALIGVLPLVARKLVALLRRKKEKSVESTIKSR